LVSQFFKPCLGFVSLGSFEIYAIRKFFLDSQGPSFISISHIFIFYHYLFCMSLYLPFDVWRNILAWLSAQINVDDIAVHHKFEIIEQNIDLIVQYELDDAQKVLDQDLVKLFKLAQMSISYLRHCLIYLDKGVVILQDQLKVS